MLTIYHNNRCRKSRGGLQYLEQKGLDFEIVDYINNPLSSDKIAELLKKLGKKPFDIVRTQEEIYKKNYKGKAISDNEWLKILAENPKLIHRPIIVKGDKAVLGDIVEHIDTLL